MRIIIILGLTLLMGVVGWIGTMEAARQIQNASGPPPTVVRTGDRNRDLMESMRQFNKAAGDMADRQRYGMIGGGVGLAVGFISGVALVLRRDRRQA